MLKSPGSDGHFGILNLSIHQYSKELLQIRLRWVAVLTKSWQFRGEYSVGGGGGGVNYN